MTKLASSILPHNTPMLLGCFTTGTLQLLLLSYIGHSLGEWSDLDDVSIRELIGLIKTLHANGLHHHDLHPPNITFYNGCLGIIDFGMSDVIADGVECIDCEDDVVIGELQELLEDEEVVIDELQELLEDEEVAED
ncbi:hypothetical protein K435DRAFT_810405 [Dendrothele bispora CBS 962.96]|nr:hypothetical protein K435DRAFT_810405 [Dendrothele bispora CBS 962.96]